MKSTAGESPTASASMRNSASRSQPSLLTGTKASLTPVMFSTAAISALATAAWETITARRSPRRSEEHTSELQSRGHLVCRLLLEKKKKKIENAKTVHGHSLPDEHMRY